MITNGTILIEGDALHPQCFQLEDDSCPNGWMLVRHYLTHRELEKELSRTGWTFFYMATGIRTTAFGIRRTKMIRAALKRAISAVRLQRCNCLEIEAVTAHRFLWIPYVSVSAHPRHIQRGRVFSGQQHQ